MPRYPSMMMFTPNRKAVRVNVINLKHPVKQGKKVHRVPLVDFSGVKFIARCGMERIENGRDCMYLWTGDRGSGKSTCIGHTGLAIDPELTLDAVVFWLEKFGHRLATTPKGGWNATLGRYVYPQTILDEAGHALYGPQWLAREQLEISKNMIINRVMGQIIHAAVPKRKQFNNQLRDMAFMWIHVSEPVEYKQGFAVVRLAPPAAQSEFYSEKFWIPKMAFIFPKLTGKWWDEYENKKIAFVKEASENIGKASQGKAAKYIQARDAVMCEYYEYRKTRKDKITFDELGALTGLTKGQVSNIINKQDSPI